MNGLSLRVSGGNFDKKKNDTKFCLFNLSNTQKSRFSYLENINEFMDALSINKQLEYIRNIAKILDTNDNEQSIHNVIEFLVMLFLEAPIKHPMKNTSSRILISKNNFRKQIENIISKEISLKISNMDDNDNYNALNDLCNILNSCFENFPPGIGAIQISLKNVLMFLNNTLKVYVSIVRNDCVKLSPTGKMELYSYIHNTNRLLISILQKCDVDLLSSENIEDWTSFCTSCIFLLRHEDLPMDTKGLCSMILIIILRIRFGSDAWIFVLQIIYGLNDHSDHLLNEEIKCLKSETEKLSICSSIINVVQVDDLCLELDEGISALNFLCAKLKKLGEELTVDATIILSVARTMLSISNLLFKVTYLNITVEAAGVILTFIWSHLDHYIDSVRHLATQTLTNIVKLSVTLDSKGNCNLSKNIFSSVMSLPNDRHSKYKGLATLSSEYGTLFLLNKYPNLVEDLLAALNNITIPTNVSIVFEILMSQYSKEVSKEVLFETWIEPILEAVIACKNEEDSATTTALTTLEDILARAVKINSDIVPLMMPAITKQNTKKGDKLSDDQLKCILLCLHVARKIGIFDSKELLKSSNSTLWKDIIPYELLENSVIHRYSEIKILALSLIVDSHKTTECFTHEEFSLLIQFYHYNVNIQSPAVRQRILALTKKLLKRWKDGYDVILRNIDTLSNKIKKFNDNSVPNAQNNHVYQLLECLFSLKNYYMTFIKALWNFCISNIFQGANFSRRNISLQILVWCQEVNQFQIDWNWKDEHFTSLLNYLEDSYECNKQLVVEILSSYPVHQSNYDKIFLKTFEEAMSGASSVKPTDCMSSAYKFEFLTKFPDRLLVLLGAQIVEKSQIQYKVHYYLIKKLMTHLEVEMNVAKQNILMAAASGPLYGLLHCIRHVLGIVSFSGIASSEDWSSLVQQLIQMSFEVNEIVAPIVNNSSPEGHLPMDFNAGSAHIEGNGVQLESGRRVTAQMVLLCAWRSVKEVSLLLGDISHKAIIIENVSVDNVTSANKDHAKGTVTEKMLLEIGDHFTTLLSETKHRGAFEQAYLGFSKLCSRLWKCNSKTLHNLPRIWLDDLILAISSGDSKNSKLCATRRSAGVPFMVQALVTTELQVSGNPQNFQKCMSTLLQLATFKSTTNEAAASVETRTHCLNILRALYRHTALGEYVNPYVADGLMTAIIGFDGATWAERNSSTLLFSSLVTRIFGVQRTKDSDALCIRNKMTGRIFFLRYPKLYDFILKHLSDVNDNIDSKNFLKPSLYPILLLLARLYPSSLEGTDSNLQLVAYIPYLMICSKSCVLKTRQLAAKAMVPLISQDRYSDHLINLLKILNDTKMKANHCHGILLQMIKLLQSTPESLTADQLDIGRIIDLLNGTQWILRGIYENKPCFVMAEAYLKAILLLINRFEAIATTKPTFFEEIKIIIPESQPLNESWKLHFNKELFYVQALHLNIHLSYMRKNIPEVCFILINSLKHFSYEVQLISLDYLLCFYNNSSINSIDEQFELGSNEKKFTEKLSYNELNEIFDNLHSSSDFQENIFSLIQPYIYLRCRQKAMMILSFLPGVSGKILEYFAPNSSHDTQLNTLINLVDSEHENINYIYLRYINVCFDNEKITSIYECYSEETVLNLSKILLESSYPDKTIYKRRECTEILITHWKFFDCQINLGRQKTIEGILMQWLAILQLLDDDEEPIRFRVANLANDISSNENYNQSFPVNENKAKEKILDVFSLWLCSVSVEYSIVLLIILAFGDSNNISEDNDNQECQVFDKGEINIFQEEIAIVKICANQIKKNLSQAWNLMEAKEKIIYILNTIESNCGIEIKIIENSEMSLFKYFLKRMLKNHNDNDSTEFLQNSKVNFSEISICKVKTLINELGL